MPDYYDDADGGFNAEDAAQAPDVEAVEGACPPRILWYRIYPEADFNDLFGNPPASVNT